MTRRSFAQRPRQELRFTVATSAACLRWQTSASQRPTHHIVVAFTHQIHVREIVERPQGCPLNAQILFGIDVVSAVLREDPTVRSLAKINCLFWRDSVSPWKLSRLRNRLTICRSVTGYPVTVFVQLGPEGQTAFRRERFTITSWFVSGHPRQLWVIKHSVSTCSFRVESDERRSEVHRQASATPISTNDCGCRPPPSVSKRRAQAWHPAATGATFRQQTSPCRRQRLPVSFVKTP